MTDSDNDVSKRVKFAYDPEAEAEKEAKDFYDEEEEGNDLDLDTIKASRNKPKGLKEFDSEGSESEEEDQEAEFASKFNESDSEESNEDDNEEELDERQVPLMPFNLREDREEGNFDADGFYTRKQDEEADQDRWMANFTRSDIIKARKAHEHMIELKNKVSKWTEGKSERELYAELTELLVENDLTVLEVIRQCSKQKEADKPRAPLNKNRLKKLQKETNQFSDNPINTSNNNSDKEKLERITEIADALMDLGNFGVYEETRREIMRKYTK